MYSPCFLPYIQKPKILAAYAMIPFAPPKPYNE